MEVDKEIVIPPLRYDYSKCISITQVMWWKNDIQKFREILVSFSGEAKFIWGPTELTGGETFTTLANQRETKMLSCLFSNKKSRSMLYYCKKCNVVLCVVGCFEKWHTHVRV
ncbi:hypothetical protein B7P43_G08577 [Cryptotermes secundus]|uniref:PiggyBac transposable element-derived protein domain-containing protein n=1 Tax=Cryptotermes secundus TaxID=105785 RepID=A0A2J7R4X5_9NEOP|nr:hypothetical protein B7P43_G08577 [Cryptotermes secundus]